MPDGVQSVTGRSWGKVVVGFEVNDMPDRIHRVSRSSRESTVVTQTISSAKFREDSSNTRPRRWSIASILEAFITVVLLLPAVAFAQQSPWERAASNLEFTFTGPLARSLALVAIVIGGLMFMFGEGGAKRQISGIVFGGGLALFAAQFMTWLF
ncbi:MAG: TrbC/VirB2 family protein [Vicinamibacterales bacterium]